MINQSNQRLLLWNSDYNPSKNNRKISPKTDTAFTQRTGSWLWNSKKYFIYFELHSLTGSTYCVLKFAVSYSLLCTIRKGGGEMYCKRSSREKKSTPTRNFKKLNYQICIITKFHEKNNSAKRTAPLTLMFLWRPCTCRKYEPEQNS